MTSFIATMGPNNGETNNTGNEKKTKTFNITLTGTKAAEVVASLVAEFGRDELQRSQSLSMTITLTAGNEQFQFIAERATVRSLAVPAEQVDLGSEWTAMLPSPVSADQGSADDLKNTYGSITTDVSATRPEKSDRVHDGSANDGDSSDPSTTTRLPAMTASIASTIDFGPIDGNIASDNPAMMMPSPTATSPTTASTIPSPAVLMPPPAAPASRLTSLQRTAGLSEPNQQLQDPAIVAYLSAVAASLFHAGFFALATDLGQFSVDLVGEDLWNEKVAEHLGAEPHEGPYSRGLLDSVAYTLRDIDPAEGQKLSSLAIRLPPSMQQTLYLPA